MRLAHCALLLVLTSGVTACNQQPPAGGVPANDSSPGGQASVPAAGETGDPKELLRQMSAFYRQKRTAQVEYEQQVSMELGGQKNAMEARARITMERPNRIAIRQADPQMGLDVVCDGKELSISVAPLKQYSQSPAPDTFDELLANPLVSGGAAGRGPLLDVFGADPYKTLMEGVKEAKYAGRAQVGEDDAHHLKFVQDQFDWEVWIAAGSEPRLLQAKFDLVKSLAAQGLDEARLKDAKLTSVQKYTNWKFDAELPGDAFVFEPPEGAQKVDDFFAGRRGRRGRQPSQLIGKPAPDVEQDLLEGGHFSLKELKDNKIVILDFWATWCGPCVREMPIVAKVAEEYRDKDVALYCVNQGEEAATIREFLEEKKLNVTVSLDPSGETAGAYFVEGIPMLVLVDKAGIVRSVHVGFSPGIGDKLREELDAIVAGKTLNSEAPDSKDKPEEADESDESP